MPMTLPLIPVVRPSLPPLEEFIPYLHQIWESQILTNGGPFHKQLESTLCETLGVPHLALFNNGTNALITALQAMDLVGEVITTPYSFVATSHALVWNNLTPVFVDVDPDTLNINPAKIEAAITPQTSAILAVHCYGNPCDVDAIAAIAKKHNIKVVYDAAHAFGVTTPAGSVLNAGDCSVLSLHATKVFNTFEGGAIICPDAATKARIDRLKNFGIVDETTITEVGSNGKMSELNAAFGLVQVKHMETYRAGRQRVDAFYRKALEGVSGVRCISSSRTVLGNYAYFPILLDATYPLTRDALYAKLKEHNILARRYFYPLLSNLPMYADLPSAAPGNLPVATAAAQNVLCLPMYPTLSEADMTRIITLIKGL